MTNMGTGTSETRNRNCLSKFNFQLFLQMAELTSTQTDQESFRCPICLERLNIPRYLPCLHTFCEVCIQTYMSSTVAQDKENESNVINCPVCRQQVKEPKKEISSEDWAKSLPLNKWIWTMTENSETDSVINCLWMKPSWQITGVNHVQNRFAMNVKISTHEFRVYRVIRLSRWTIQWNGMKQLI